MKHPVFEKLYELTSTIESDIPPRLHTFEEIISAEEKLKITFPEDYRIFLLHYYTTGLINQYMAHVYSQIPKMLPIFPSVIGLRRHMDTLNIEPQFIPFLHDVDWYFCFDRDNNYKVVVYPSYSYQTGKDVWVSFSEWVEKDLIINISNVLNPDFQGGRRSRGENVNLDKLFSFPEE